MTDTINPTSADSAIRAKPALAAATEPRLDLTTDSGAPGRHECVDVDPTTLILGDNVRAKAHLDRQFLASLRHFGVMDPIHANRADDGTLTVKRGHRRTLGAVKVGLATVPVLIVADDDSEAERITKQWHENERRDCLTDTDRLAAVEQLTILGVPAGSIAKRLGTPRKVIEAAVTANASQVAKTAATTHTLTLTDAALIAEFENDENVVKDILTAVKDGRSTEHVAQRARDARERQRAHCEAVAALTEAGVRVIDRPDHANKTITELRDIRLLTKAGAAKSKAPTQAEHTACPGHAAYVTVDAWSATPRARTTYVCTNPTGNGHAVRTYDGTRLPGETPGGPMSEAQKAERRTLIANNKAWDAADKVRRAWIADALLTRTSPPKNAEAFVALAVVHGEHTQDDNRLYTALTHGQQDYQATSRLIVRAQTASPRHALMLALALLVCEWESGTSRTTWRHPSERDRRYLGALVQWGYQPADIEQLILTDPTATADTDVDGPDGTDPHTQAAATGQSDDLHADLGDERAVNDEEGPHLEGNDEANPDGADDDV